MCFWMLEFHATHCKDRPHYELRECDFKLNFALSSKYLLNPLTPESAFKNSFLKKCHRQNQRNGIRDFELGDTVPLIPAVKFRILMRGDFFSRLRGT